MASEAVENLLDPAAVGEYLGGISEETLTKWRYLGKGPRWYKCGKHVRYRRSDIDSWLESQRAA